MACSFSFPFTGDASSLTASIRRKVLAGNGQFGGDDSTGNFALEAIGASIAGVYAINGNEIMITIQKKPFFLSCNMIRDYVSQNLTS